MRGRGWAAVLSLVAVPLLVAAPASAHVTAVAPDAVAGGFTVVTLRVPTESATASTIGLEVELPRDHPLAVVRNETTPGWEVAVERTRLSTPIDNGHGKTVDEAVSTVTFTAHDGAGIAPGEFAEFRLFLGPFPDSGVLTLPTRQTYSDGTEVAWIERSTDGTEADKPAPEIRLTGGGGHGGHGGSPVVPAATSGGGWAGNAALGVSLLALIVAVATAARARGANPSSAVDPSTAA